MEEELEEHDEEVIDIQENQFLAYFDDEEGELTLQEEKEEKEVPLEDQAFEEFWGLKWAS